MVNHAVRANSLPVVKFNPPVWSLFRCPVTDAVHKAIEIYVNQGEMK